MGHDVSLACACGAVTGVLEDISPDLGDHVVCHCRDCQNFARFLGAEARLLDRYGGTALYQTRCARLRLTAGREKLACLHLTDKPTLRWYAACCRTPMFNTYANGRIPYVTTVVANCDPNELTAKIGPVGGRFHLAPELADRSDLKGMPMRTLLRRFAGRMMRDILSGDRRRAALFDANTLAPIETPYRLTGAERAALARS